MCSLNIDKLTSAWESLTNYYQGWIACYENVFKPNFEFLQKIFTFEEMNIAQIAHIFSQNRSIHSWYQVKGYLYFFLFIIGRFLQGKR